MRRLTPSPWLCFLVSIAVTSCASETRRPPPAQSIAAAPATDSAGAASRGPAADLALPGTPPSDAAPPVEAATQAAGPDTKAAPKAVVELFGPDGGLLEQTNELPSTSSASFVERTRLLFDAIVKDDPASARSSFFPLPAYEKVKAIADPARDWERRLIAAFARDIHEYHQKLGAEPEKAKLVSLTVPNERARWMKPGSEGNRIGYHRVLRSELRYTDAAGRQGSLPILSMISWRGEWYVVHLKSFE